MAIKGEPLAKGWKELMLAAVAGSSYPAGIDKVPSAHEQRQQKPRPHTVHDFDVPFGKHPLDRFLDVIGELESSSGKNENHERVLSGMHAGTSAIGRFGMMPKTFKDVASKLQSSTSPMMSALGTHFKDPELMQLAVKNPDEIKSTLVSNPNLKLRAARYLAAHLHKLHDGDVLRMAHGWRFGSNRSSAAITDKHLNDSGYVRRFKELYETAPEPSISEVANDEHRK